MTRITLHSAMDAELLRDILDRAGSGKRVLKLEAIAGKRIEPFCNRLSAIRADEKEALGIDYIQLCSQTKITLVY